MHILLLAEPADAEVFSRELRRGGISHVPHCATVRESFLAALKEFKPELILADQLTRGLGAMEALAVAREACPEVPLIMVIGTLADGSAVETIRRGAADYVLKEHLSQLVPTVMRVLRGAEERQQRRRAETLLEVKYQQLQLQNDALQQSEERFRQLAETIREVFWMTDVERTQMLYVSPAYEEVWGRSCASLYAFPSEWLDAIHAEDRDRVRNAARDEKCPGKYDEEYRILRPDHSVRWIHDRAFPVRDETGAVYRIAGVAEDITSRKHLEKQVLEISDREQERIGRDLHDELCQLLVSIGFNANTLKLDLERQSKAEASAAERIGRKLSTAIKMARDLAHGLCPVNFETENLATALAQLARNTSDDFGGQCSAECPAANLITDPTVATHVYRIAREAVHNAVKHGTPTRIQMRLSAEAGRVLLTVSDNGSGISAQPAPGPGMGLEIMKYRASMLCGKLEIRRLPESEGTGTVVACSFPPR